VARGAKRSASNNAVIITGRYCMSKGISELGSPDVLSIGKGQAIIRDIAIVTSSLSHYG
jgi:hypothetical protein